MSTFKLIFAVVLILLMLVAIAQAFIAFDNGDELKAIFDIATMAFTTSFLAWLLILIKY